MLKLIRLNLRPNTCLYRIKISLKSLKYYHRWSMIRSHFVNIRRTCYFSLYIFHVRKSTRPSNSRTFGQLVSQWCRLHNIYPLFQTIFHSKTYSDHDHYPLFPLNHGLACCKRMLVLFNSGNLILMIKDF